MPTPKKEAIVADVRGALDASTGVVVISFAGLSVPLITQLRSKLRQAGARMAVVKNRLVKLAIAETDAEALGEALAGPNALVFCSADVPPAVKLMADFEKEHGGIQFRASYLDGTVYDAARTQALATVPSKPELLASALAALNAPITGLVFTLQGIVSEFVYTLQAVADKQAQEAA